MTVRAELAAALLPVREDGRVLLVQRSSGTWDPPGGRLAPGESFEGAAVRELREETGLLVAPQRVLATWVGERGGEPLAAITYAGRVLDRGIQLSGEHLDWRWTAPEEWPDLPSWWSREDRRRAADALSALPESPSPEPPPPESIGDERAVSAHLGAGAVLVDIAGDEPRALLMRRRKPPLRLWENPGGMLEPGEDFAACAARETREETGIEAEPHSPWWARVEPWRGPQDTELYAGAGFLARHPGGEVRLEDAAHDAHLWATEGEWRQMRTWYTERELDGLWSAIRRMDASDE